MEPVNCTSTYTPGYSAADAQFDLYPPQTQTELKFTQHKVTTKNNWIFVFTTRNTIRSSTMVALSHADRQYAEQEFDLSSRSLSQVRRGIKVPTTNLILNKERQYSFQTLQ